MNTRVTSNTVTFANAFQLDEIEGVLPAGAYRIETEEELLANVSFVAYRRVATHIFVPPRAGEGGGVQMWAIHPNGLSAALLRDRA